MFIEKEELESFPIDVYEYETGIPYHTASMFSGSMNTAIGFNSLYSNTTGSNNVAFGANALYNNTTGSNNIAIGSNALSENTNESDQIGIGPILVTNYVTNPSLVIKSCYGQTANLQEWRNSSGSVISGVDSEGNIFKYDSKGNKIYV